MVVFLIRHYRATIAFITCLVVPLFMFTFGFFLDVRQTSAAVKIHRQKIIKLEESVYRTDERFKLIQHSLEVLEDREYQELKQARQARQPQNKP